MVTRTRTYYNIYIYIILHIYIYTYIILHIYIYCIIYILLYCIMRCTGLDVEIDCGGAISRG